MINQEDYEVGDGTVIRTKETTWHYWMNSNETSQAQKAIGEAADGISVTTFKATYFIASLFTGGGANLITTGISRIATEVGGQVMSTGSDLNKFNVTAIITSSFFGGSFNQIVQKNVINSFLEFSPNGTYNGVNFSWGSIKEKTVQAGIGVLVIKF